MSNNITLTPGKHYRARDGKKVRIYATDGRGPIRCHGAYLTPYGWQLTTWTGGGEYSPGSETVNDIISEWIDRPEGGWEHLPPWIKWRAMDEDGRWFGCEEKPARLSSKWEPDFRKSFILIPPDYCPTYTGPWTDSLDERPEKGAAQ